MTNRITLEQLKAAYAKTGLRPARYDLYGAGTACVAGVLYMVNDVTSLPDLARKLETPQEYLYGVVAGFDNVLTLFPYAKENNREAWDCGVADGTSFREELKPE